MGCIMSNKKAVYEGAYNKRKTIYKVRDIENNKILEQDFKTIKEAKMAALELNVLIYGVFENKQYYAIDEYEVIYLKQRECTKAKYNRM